MHQVNKPQAEITRECDGMPAALLFVYISWSISQIEVGYAVNGLENMYKFIMTWILVY